MFCPNCGEELPDGSKFCSSCGENITDAAATNVSKPGFVPFKKIIAIVVVVIVAMVAVWGLKTLLSSSKGNNAYAYLSNGKYELITNLSKDQTIEIASRKSDDMGANSLAFSPDGKYIYYYTKYDSYSGTASLCRAEYGKLKEDTSKNDKYIEIIDTNVSLDLFHFLSDGSLAYENGDDTLYYFDGKESVQIAKNISYYYTDESDKILYATGNKYEGYTLYGVSLSNLDNKIKLASNVSALWNNEDFENIPYTKHEDDNTETLYVVGFSKEAEKLAENVSYLTQDDGKIYFTAANGTMLNLYDFVDDAYADSDAGITEPSEDDFRIPAYSYYQLYKDYDPGEYSELYTTCTQYTYFWHDAIEDISYDDCKAFTEKYKSLENEDGYFVVTGEIKKDLEAMVAEHGQGYDGEWLEFCFHREELVKTTDYDAYNAAYEKWQEAQNRIALRETLQDKENDYAVQTLYCFDKGNLTAINETVLNAKKYSGAVVFNTTDLITEKVKLENVFSVSDVQKLFDINNGAENFIILADGTSCKMSSKAAETFAAADNSDSVALYVTKKEVYMSEDNGALSVAVVSGGVVGDFSIVTDDAEVLSVDDSTLYYAGGSYQNNDATYGDLYSCKNGTSTRMARDVMGYATLYSDGMMLAYTGYESSSGRELSMINAKGESTLIGDNVTQYIRVDKSTLLYISDGDLYSYNGKKKKMVRSDVDMFWCQNSIESYVIFGWSYDD